MRFRSLFAALILALALHAAPAHAQRTAMNYRGAYAGGTNYQNGDSVASAGATYVSIISNNHGNTPASSPSDWAPLGGSGVGTLGLIPVETYGAVGDSNGLHSNGTDNTTALTSCISALNGTYIGCLLQASKIYRTTGTLTISGNGTGLVGPGAGFTAPVTSIVSSAASLMIDSASANAIDVNGTFDVLQNFTIFRPVLPTGTATGVAFGPRPASDGAIVNNVYVEDNIRGFSWLGGASLATGQISNTAASTGYNANVTGYGTTPIWGYYLFSDSTNFFASLNINNAGFADYAGDTASIGLALIGSGSSSQCNDVYVTGFSTASTGLAISVNCPSLLGVYDDHFRDLILQSNNGIKVVEQSAASSNAQLEFISGWFASTPGTGKAFDIENSQGVTIDNFQVFNGVASLVSNSNRIAIRNSNFTGYSGAGASASQVNISDTTGSIFSNNLAQATPTATPCFLCFGGSSLNSAMGNAMEAPTGTTFTTGISFDAASNNNAVCGNVLSGNGGTVGAVITDAGTGNSCQNVSGTYSPPGTPLEAWLSQDGTLPLHNSGSDSTNTATGSGVTFSSSSGFTTPVATYDGTHYVTATSATNTSFSNSTPFTVAAWVNATSGGGVVGTTTAGTFGQGWQLNESGGYPAFSLISTATTNALYVYVGTPLSGGLHHLCAVYDGTSVPSGVHIYVDGALQSGITNWNTLTSSAVSGNPVSIGVGTAGTIGNVEIFANNTTSCAAINALGPNTVY
jgi:hypothetical protein